jgi:MoaA/NifB/PqqE/SkfB family radical SAM enzyme
VNLTEYLNISINGIFRQALRFSLTNPRECSLLIRAAALQRGAAKKRFQSEQEGNPIPPFLIASIATRCNLHCAGCYARANQFCSDTEDNGELSAKRWGELFAEAEMLGVSFVLLAGGEPLERPDVLDQAAKTTGLIFPVFTNGTLFTEKTLGRFDRNRNLFPIVSIEGDQLQTDSRRGEGTFRLIARAMDEMKRRGIFYGVSITVTKENLLAVTSEGFIAGLRENGCKAVVFVEYVPVDGNRGLEPGEEEHVTLAERQESLRLRFRDTIFLSFPGDEKQLGGCLAAGRGFFHINPFGGAEPCPFSPYTDTNLKSVSIRQALDSALFRRIRQSGIQAEEHAGGCVLFDQRTAVESMLKNPLASPLVYDVR